MTTTDGLVSYYQNLLVVQYNDKPKAAATVGAVVQGLVMPQSAQLIAFTFTGSLTGGTFTVTAAGKTSAAINWNDDLATIQTKIQGVLPGVVVTGDLTAGLLVSKAPWYPLATVSSSLTASGGAVTVAVTSAPQDLPLPLAVADAFNLAVGSDSFAVGAQLDVLGKYAGVSRTGVGFFGQLVTLSDADFLTLIRLAQVVNSGASDLASIQQFFHDWFPGQIQVSDNQAMSMSFMISSAIGSADLVQRFVNSGLLPRPMGVQASVIYAPTITNFFGCTTYETSDFTNRSPLNTYESYQTDRPFVTYENAIIPPT